MEVDGHGPLDDYSPLQTGGFPLLQFMLLHCQMGSRAWPSLEAFIEKH